jgi:hypothetical protein
VAGRVGRVSVGLGFGFSMIGGLVGGVGNGIWRSILG